MHDLEAVKTNFDGITYAKGASVLQQLVSHVGKTEFIAGLVIISPSMRGAIQLLTISWSNLKQPVAAISSHGLQPGCKLPA